MDLFSIKRKELEFLPAGFSSALFVSSKEKKNCLPFFAGPWIPYLPWV